PLSKYIFLQHMSLAAKDANIAVLRGHAFHIGGILEYLLQGVPFEVVKSHGCWKGDAFRLYLCKHAQVIAPYIQARPDAHADFMRIVMPRVC
ncbi:hypothetical protein BDY19DRAFT_895623, partial [Irpex rosettiformis]